jgi:hypothetical protein
VVTAGAVAAGRPALEAMRQRFDSSRVEHERMALAFALGCFSQWPLLVEALDFALERVPDRIRFIPLVAAAGNPAAADRLWAWFDDNFQRIGRMHSLLFERVVAAFVPGPGLQDPDRTGVICERMRHQQPRLQDVVALSLERLQVNAEFRQREQDRQDG